MHFIPQLAACRACNWRIRMIVQEVRRFQVQLERFDHRSHLDANCRFGGAYSCGFSAIGRIMREWRWVEAMRVLAWDL